MLIYPEINPVAIQIGSIQIYWYALMYLSAFAFAWGLGRYRAWQSYRGWSDKQVDDLIFFAAIGVIVGGRVGYVLFYNTSALWQDPLSLIRVWQGGMSFHGGLLGVITALGIFTYWQRKNFWDVADFIAPLAPLGLGLGRIGNFINGELWGRVSDVPWAMIFPHVDEWPRHPSMLYEAILEGLILFVVIWWFSAKLKPRAAVTGLFLLTYGVLRFAVEFVREPDRHLGFLWSWVTMGQLLSIPMIIGGIGLMIWAYQRESSCNNI
ncbi:MAG: prolipoprotein diacylglyceryl transferase [Legionellales bacterium]|nr:prolipoprotein diacylglyceryl transferase [Legionellales bacterium]